MTTTATSSISNYNPTVFNDWIKQKNLPRETTLSEVEMARLEPFYTQAIQEDSAFRTKHMEKDYEVERLRHFLKTGEWYPKHETEIFHPAYSSEHARSTMELDERLSRATSSSATPVLGQLYLSHPKRTYIYPLPSKKKFFR